MADKMTIDVALKNAKRISDGFAKWGRNTVSPFNEPVLLQIIATLVQHGNFDDSDADVVKLRRQLAAANARIQKLAKKYNIATESPNGDYPG